MSHPEGPAHVLRLLRMYLNPAGSESVPQGGEPLSQRGSRPAAGIYTSVATSQISLLVYTFQIFTDLLPAINSISL